MTRKPNKKPAKAAKVLSIAFSSDDSALLKQIGSALKAALAKVPALNGVTVPMTISDGWSQTGGWVREQDGWPQEGGWYLSTNKTHLDQSNPPLEESLRDVLVAFDKARKAASKVSNTE
jgi:hypothetical protein